MLLTTTFPKLKLVVLAPNRNVFAIPVPERGIASGEFGALLTIESEPVAAPPEVGPKAILGNYTLDLRRHLKA